LAYGETITRATHKSLAGLTRPANGRIAKRTEKGDLGGRVHIELSPGLEPPRQLLLGFRILGSLTRRIHASEPRRERVGKIIRLLGGQATRIRLSWHPHPVVQRNGRPGLDAIRGHQWHRRETDPNGRYRTVSGWQCPH
jgi:hypothetical protein